mgnify:CR=1 FL=1|tara:strand:- start:2959 stop:3225 length:267 start_codon:yes stop_codon:yes gene_type:complete
MGHIRIAKASGFDITSADGVLSVKIENTDDIVIAYSGGTKSTIVGTGLAEADAMKIKKAIDIMDGAAGPAPLVELSTKSIAVSGALLT